MSGKTTPCQVQVCRKSFAQVLFVTSPVSFRQTVLVIMTLHCLANLGILGDSKYKTCSDMTPFHLMLFGVAISGPTKSAPIRPSKMGT